MNINNVYIASVEFIENRYNENIVNPILNSFSISDFENIAQEFKINDFNFTNIINHNALFSENVKIYLNELIVDVTDTNYVYIDIYDSLKNKITSWEDIVLNINNITNEEKQTLLITSSILRYSLLAWWDANFDIDDNNFIEISLLKRVVGVVVVAATDAVAGSVGNVIGGPVGAVVVGGATSALAAGILKEKGYFKK